MFGSVDIAIDALPDEIRDLVIEILSEHGRASLTGAEIDALLGYAADHPELFEGDAPPTDSVGDGVPGGSSDSTTTTGGDQPHD